MVPRESSAEHDARQSGSLRRPLEPRRAVPLRQTDNSEPDRRPWPNEVSVKISLAQGRRTHRQKTTRPCSVSSSGAEFRELRRYGPHAERTFVRPRMMKADAAEQPDRRLGGA